MMTKRQNTWKISEVSGEVKKCGDGAHVYLPSSWIGREVKVIDSEGEYPKITKTVSMISNGAHVMLPLNWMGKSVRIVPLA